MNRLLVILPLLLVPAVSARVASRPVPCERYDTAIDWIRDLQSAADLARDEDRLLMVVHLSGELDDPEKT